MLAALLLSVLLFTSPSRHAHAADRQAADADGIARAIQAAKPGDTITIRPGKYRIGRTVADTAGRSDAPITVRAAQLGSVLIETNDAEAFVVAESYWVFENLMVRGGVSSEHAFHIVRRASHTVVRNNLLFDLDAMIKGNGANDGAERFFPDDVLIEGNIMLNTALRSGERPVTPIDVVGGARWVVRGNFIADFGKANSSFPSYGAFFKGNSHGGVMERNLVVCRWRVPEGSAVRVGLSLGGGGTPDHSCRDRKCITESRGETLRANIVMNCDRDISIYINKAADARIVDNTVYNSYGIDVRFPESSARVSGNILSAGIRTRDGGSLTRGDNFEYGMRSGLRLRQASAGLDGKLASASHDYSWATGWLGGLRGLVSAIDDAIATGPLGRNVNAQRRTFMNPDAFDFALRGELPTRQMKAESETDFCGRSRDPSRSTYGAIAYEAGPCDVGALVRKADALLKTLPRD